jgi:hypothetical protein
MSLRQIMSPTLLLVVWLCLIVLIIGITSLHGLVLIHINVHTMFPAHSIRLILLIKLSLQVNHLLSQLIRVCLLLCTLSLQLIHHLLHIL